MRTMGLSLGLALLCLLRVGAEDLGAAELDMSKVTAASWEGQEGAWPPLTGWGLQRWLCAGDIPWLCCPTEVRVVTQSLEPRGVVSVPWPEGVWAQSP